MRAFRYTQFEDLDTSTYSAASAFSLEGIEGATTGNSDKMKDYYSDFTYVELTVSGISAEADIDGLTVSYDNNTAYPLKGVSGNICQSFSCRKVLNATISIPIFTYDKRNRI